jgi:predicted ester cyclase
MKEYVRMYRSAFPDLRVILEEQVAEGNKVVNRWTARGTNQG